MFNKDFFPTPDAVIEVMLQNIDLRNKIVLEPSAGRGNIVDYLNKEKAKKVVAFEKDRDLAKIVQSKCTFLGYDFLEATKEQVSAVNLVVMNPPFSEDEKHILHAWEIMPAGASLVSLLNVETYKNTYTRNRKVLRQIVADYGTFQDLGDVFKKADRATNVSIGLIRLTKPNDANSQDEFAGYFDLFDTDERQGKDGDGLMPYNEIRDYVQRYVGAVKLYDEIAYNAVRMNDLVGIFGVSTFAFILSEKDVPITKKNFEVKLRKAAWQHIFNKMNLRKISTSTLMISIDKFFEEQQQIPFTMGNIYKMLEVIIGTTGSRMDTALVDVFERLTKNYDENRYHLEGWKTNSHYLVNRKFISPYVFSYDTKYPSNYVKVRIANRFNEEVLDDLTKSLCYLTGRDYDKIGTFRSFFYGQNSTQPKWGEKFNWGFFEVVAYKKGTGHFRFLDEKVWAMFNQRVAKLKGYPLPESVRKTPPTPPKTQPNQTPQSSPPTVKSFAEKFSNGGISPITQQPAPNLPLKIAIAKAKIKIALL